jgi:hypothetical protein
MVRLTTSVAACAALAIVVAGCGGKSKSDQYACMLRLQGEASRQAIVSMYKRGQLGTAEQLRREVGESVPFVDASGHIVSYGAMDSTHRLTFDNWILDLVSVNHTARLVRNDAVEKARARAQDEC